MLRGWLASAAATAACCCILVALPAVESAAAPAAPDEAPASDGSFTCAAYCRCLAAEVAHCATGSIPSEPNFAARYFMARCVPAAPARRVPAPARPACTLTRLRRARSASPRAPFPCTTNSTRRSGRGSLRSTLRRPNAGAALSRPPAARRCATGSSPRSAASAALGPAGEVDRSLTPPPAAARAAEPRLPASHRLRRRPRFGLVSRRVSAPTGARACIACLHA